MQSRDILGMAIKPQNCELARVFAANVRRIRNEHELSQEELADLAGVHRTYVGMLERSEKNVTIYNIERIARALNVHASTLLERDARRK